MSTLISGPPGTGKSSLAAQFVSAFNKTGGKAAMFLFEESKSNLLNRADGLNMDLRDRRLVDAIVGLEYDAGCWLGRVVVERLQLSRSTSNQRILFQLEFTGFSRIGANSLQTLQEQVPRYKYLREEINPPSRFQNYD